MPVRVNSAGSAAMDGQGFSAGSAPAGTGAASSKDVGSAAAEDQGFVTESGGGSGSGSGSGGGSGKGGGGGGGGGGGADDSAGAGDSGGFKWKGWEDRVAFDPEFPFKVLVEQASDSALPDCIRMVSGMSWRRDCHWICDVIAATFGSGLITGLLFICVGSPFAARAATTEHTRT